MPLPRFILRGEYSINTKLLYALLLGRTQLSQKSGWVSEDGDVYVIYTIRQMANDPRPAGLEPGKSYFPATAR
mgnify:CR=1 FL=1